jgi:hypothetical protein
MGDTESGSWDSSELDGYIRREEGRAMSKVTHTPGPWEVSSGMVQTIREHECKLPGCGTHIPIAYMDRTPGNGTLPVERDCNAHLIAAAPDLLYALQKCVEEMEGRNAAWGCTARAKAAIAKAEGKVTP